MNPVLGPGIGVEAAVVDPRRDDLDRTRRGQHVAWLVIAVAHHLRPLCAGYHYSGAIKRL